jgi:hypothetical protein
MATKRQFLTLYSREACHLCQDMLAQLGELRETLAFDVSVVEIDDDPALVARYGQWVPVLTSGNEEICHYFLDPSALGAYLSKIR